MSAPLRVVASEPRQGTPAAQAAGASLAEQVRGLQAEASRLAAEHVATLVESLVQTQRLAGEIANGGEAYPPGVRDLAVRLSGESAAKVHTLTAIMARL